MHANNTRICNFFHQKKLNISFDFDRGERVVDGRGRTSVHWWSICCQLGRGWDHACMKIAAAKVIEGPGCPRPCDTDA